MLTLPQATILLDLLYKLFPRDWPIIYKSIFYRISNSIPLPTQEALDKTLVPMIDTKNDLALLALVDPNPNSKKCAELIISVLTHEQLFELLENIFKLQLTTRDPTCTSVEAISALFRGDPITCYLFDELIKNSKKLFAANIQSESNDFINAVVKDIKHEPNVILEAIPLDYTMSENCAQFTARLLQSIHNKILHELSSEPVIKSLLAMIKKYAQYDNNTNLNKLNDFLLGHLANRVVSSILSHYLIHIKQKEKTLLNDLKNTTTHVAVTLNLSLHHLQAKNLKWSIANKFISKPFTYLIATDPVEKPIHNQTFPIAYHPFLLNREFKFSYIDYCDKLQYENCRHLFSNKHSSKFKVLDALGKDVFDNELQLCLWLAAIDIYKEFHAFQEKNQKTTTTKAITSIAVLQNITQLRLQYFPTFTKEIRIQMDAFLNIGNIRTQYGQHIDTLVEKLKTLKRFHTMHFNHTKSSVTATNSTGKDSKEELKSPRVRFSKEPATEITDPKALSPRNSFKS